MRGFFLATMCSALVGCFNPDVNAVACGADGLCPSGLVCDRSTNRCRLPGAGAPDASPDATDAATLNDRDNDTVIDSLDNCPDVANTMQYDEDGDDVGDDCDNCPHVANENQADDGEEDDGDVADGVGDVCDPRPQQSGDIIAVFDGFNESLASEWTVVRGGITWATSGGRLEQTSTAEGSSVLLYMGAPEVETTVLTRSTIVEINEADAGDPVRSIGVVARHDGAGYACVLYRLNPGGTNHALLIDNGGMGGNLIKQEVALAPMANEDILDLRFDLRQLNLSCEIERADLRTVVTSPDGDDFGQGFAGLRTRGLSASFDYFVAFETTN